MRPLLLNEPLVANRRDADALMFNRTPLSDRNAFFSRLVPEKRQSRLRDQLRRDRRRCFARHDTGARGIGTR